MLIIEKQQFQSAFSSGTRLPFGIKNIDWKSCLNCVKKSLETELGIKNNIEQFVLLGDGTQGIALDVGDNKVLKITVDKREAVASAKVAGQNLNYICNIFNVIKIKDSAYFLILQEKLQKLNKNLSYLLNNAIENTGIANSICDTRDYEKAKAQSYNITLRGRIYNKLEDLGIKYFKNKDYSNIPEIKSLIEDFDNDFLYIENSNIPEIYNELKKFGIHYYDFHAGNLMTRPDGTIVAIDLGYSETENPIDIKRISENIFKKILKYKI